MWRGLIAVASGLLLYAQTGQAETVRIAVISDLNGSYGSTEYGPAVSAAIADIVARRPDVVLCTGDMVAGQRSDPRFTVTELAAMWAAFRRVVVDPVRVAGIPFLPVAGNHDASAYPGFEAERGAYAAAMAPLQPDIAFAAAADYPFRWAAEVRGVLIVGLDVTVPGPLDAGQAEWLRGVLAGHVGMRSIVMGHLPLQPVSRGRETEVIGDPAFQTLLATGGVRAYLSGHHHAFALREEGGVAHVAQAALGAGPRARLGEDAISPRAYTWIEIDDDGGLRVDEVTEDEFSR